MKFAVKDLSVALRQVRAQQQQASQRRRPLKDDDDEDAIHNATDAARRRRILFVRSKGNNIGHGYDQHGAVQASQNHEFSRRTNAPSAQQQQS